VEPFGQNPVGVSKKPRDMLWQENKDMRRAKEGKKYVDVRKN
jgi:hypothetical protein